MPVATVSALLAAIWVARARVAACRSAARDHAVDQAELAGAVGWDQFAGEKHLHGGFAANVAGQGDHGGGAEQADVDAGGGEAGGVGGDGEVGGGDQLAAGGGGDAMDLGDDRLGQVDDALHQAGAQREGGLVERAGRGGAQFAQVVAGAEGGAVGGEDHHADGRVVGDGLQGVRPAPPSGRSTGRCGRPGG